MAGWIVLAAGLALVALQVLQGGSQYRRFKSLTDTADRQAMLCRWLINAFVMFGVLGVTGLCMLGRWAGSFVALPVEFAAARDRFAALAGIAPTEMGENGLIFTFAVGAGILAGGLIPLFVRRGERAGKVAVGDVEALLPRNRRELAWAAALSVNAGLVEEIFFRMMMPFAVFAVCGDVLVALVVAAVLFGAVHAYQGVAGVIGTFVVGVLLTAIYLLTGQISLAILVHIVLDLRALVLVPVLTGVLKRP